MRIAVRHENRAGGGVASALLPLVDVVFFLLLFYLIAGTLSRPEPVPAEPARSDRGAALPTRPVLFLAASGEAAFGDQRGEAAIAAAIASGAGLLRADAGARAEDVLALLARLRAAGVGDVALVTRPR